MRCVGTLCPAQRGLPARVTALPKCAPPPPPEPRAGVPARTCLACQMARWPTTGLRSGQALRATQGFSVVPSCATETRQFSTEDHCAQASPAARDDNNTLTTVNRMLDKSRERQLRVKTRDSHARDPPLHGAGVPPQPWLTRSTKVRGSCSHCRLAVSWWCVASCDVRHVT